MRDYYLFNDPATNENYTLSLHDALPILQIQQTYAGCMQASFQQNPARLVPIVGQLIRLDASQRKVIRLLNEFNERSEEHTSELQSRLHLVCRLLLEKKKRIEQRLVLVGS